MKTYLTNCVETSEEKINKMVNKAVKIDYATLLLHVTQKELDRVFPIYKTISTLSLANDWSVSFYKSKFEGKACVYVEHSRIEYIFVN